MAASLATIRSRVAANSLNHGLMNVDAAAIRPAPEVGIATGAVGLSGSYFIGWQFTVFGGMGSFEVIV